jgi:hypothetical protein
LLEILSPGCEADVAIKGKAIFRAVEMQKFLRSMVILGEHMAYSFW